jgi:hypothetical protein
MHNVDVFKQCRSLYTNTFFESVTQPLTSMLTDAYTLAVAVAYREGCTKI